MREWCKVLTRGPGTGLHTCPPFIASLFRLSESQFFPPHWAVVRTGGVKGGEVATAQIWIGWSWNGNRACWPIFQRVGDPGATDTPADLAWSPAPLCGVPCGIGKGVATGDQHPVGHGGAGTVTLRPCRFCGHPQPGRGTGKGREQRETGRMPAPFTCCTTVITSHLPSPPPAPEQRGRV